MFNVMGLLKTERFRQIWLSLFVVLFAVAAMHSQALAGDTIIKMKAYLAAWNEHDADKAASFLADDVVFFDASVGVPLKGRDNAKKNVIESFITAVPNSKWEPVGEPVVDGQTIAFEWKYSGTNTGDWADGTKATGKEFKINGMSMFRFENDKLIYQGDYYDALGFFNQLGLN